MVNNENSNGVNWNVPVAESEEGVSFFKNTIVRALLGVNTFFCLVSFGILGYFIRPTENILVLHYNVYFGVDIQGIWWQLYMLPVAGILFFFGHLFFSYRFYQKYERIAAYLMLFSSSLINIGIIIASASIAFINY
ncbi:MAG: hypothetical protein WCG73_00285 [Candidatus Moraniibacteriota bacterium]